MRFFSLFLSFSLSCQAMNSPPSEEILPSYAAHAQGLSHIPALERREEFRKVFEDFWLGIKDSYPHKHCLPKVEDILAPALTKPINKVQLLIASLMVANILTPKSKRGIVLDQFTKDNSVTLLSVSAQEFFKTYTASFKTLESQLMVNNYFAVASTILCANFTPLPCRKLFTIEEYFKASSQGCFLFSVVPPENKVIFHGGLLETPFDQVLHDMAHWTGNTLSETIYGKVLNSCLSHAIPEQTCARILGGMPKDLSFKERCDSLRILSECFFDAYKSPLLQPLEKVYLKTILFEVLHERGYSYFDNYDSDTPLVDLIQKGLKKWKAEVSSNKERVLGIKNEVDYYKKTAPAPLRMQSNIVISPEDVTILDLQQSSPAYVTLIILDPRTKPSLITNRIQGLAVPYYGLFVYKQFKKFYRDNAWALIKEGVIKIQDISANPNTLGMDYNLGLVFEKYLEMGDWFEKELKPDGKLYSFFSNAE